MSEEEFQMRLIERRNKQRLIERGVRYDPVQKQETAFDESYLQKKFERKRKGRGRR